MRFGRWCGPCVQLPFKISLREYAGEEYVRNKFEAKLKLAPFMVYMAKNKAKADHTGCTMLHKMDTAHIWTDAMQKCCMEATHFPGTKEKHFCDFHMCTFSEGEKWMLESQ